MRKTQLDNILYDIHAHGINYHTREIYLHSHTDAYDEEPGVEYRMATSFIKNLNFLESIDKSNILIHMHSIGGEWNDGMAIFNTIRAIKSPTVVLSYAQASSVSGIILQAADKRVMMPDCEFLIHHGSIALDNNSLAAKSAIEFNERICKRMLKIFAERAIVGAFFRDRGFSLRKVMNYLDNKIRNRSDWYLSAEEALYYGFCDGILGEKGYEDIDKIRNVRKYKGTTCD